MNEIMSTQRSSNNVVSFLSHNNEREMCGEHRFLSNHRGPIIKYDSERGPVQVQRAVLSERELKKYNTAPNCETNFT